jgi:hypothetical protein
MTIIEALSKVVDTIKKWCESRYIKYEDGNLSTDYKTPQDYGAGGKGLTDDTAAINQAISENDIIYFPQGTYNISSPIVVAARGKKIYGTKGTKIVANNCDGFQITNPNNMMLSDLQIVGDGSEHHGIMIDGNGYKCHFTNLSISNFSGDAFQTAWFGSGFGVCTIEKCEFRNCSNGVVCMSDAADQRNNITISENLFHTITHSAIRATGVGIIIEGNDIENCEYGVRIDNWDALPDRDDVEFCSSFSIRIIGNYMEYARRAFISLSSNYLRNADTQTLMVGVLDGVVIENNYAFVRSGNELSDDFVWVEFVSYAADDTPEGTPGNLIGDVTFAGNVFNTDRWPLPTIINGNNLLTKSCRFTISRVSRGSCANMGEAVIVRDTDEFEDTGGIHESNISITDDGNGNVVIQ